MSTSPKPVCTVCIANYNGIGLIDACIDSVLAQDCGFEVEIVVHDDASSDGSAAHIKERYPQVVLIDSAENVGFCVANNRMAKAARGEYLLLLNNDAELFLDALRTLCRAATDIGEPAILGLPQYDAASGKLIDIGSSLDIFLNPMPDAEPAPATGVIIGACMWLPRSLWMELGGFPDWFGSLAEDTYLCCVARLQGHPVRVLPNSGFRHWVGASLGGGKVTADRRLTTSIKRRALSERNKNYVMTLTYPAPLFQLIFPLHVFLLLLEGGILSLAKRDARLWKDVYWRSLSTLLRERKRLCTLRASVQATRRIPRFRFFDGFAVVPHKLRLLFRHGLPDIH
ncbi:MAG TPA: glycosyltransferase [Paucimonas sp.]|nr:glycosyltransferase [Paucimonas sp.]